MVRMITAVAGFHITLYSVPSMRLQRRPSAAPRCSRGRSWEWRPYPWRPPSLFTRRVHRRVIASAPRRRPAVPNHPAARARTSSTTITAPTLVPQGPVPRVHRPPLRSLRPPQLRPRGGLRASPRTSRTPRRAASRNGGPLPPFTRIDARMIQNWAPSRADWRNEAVDAYPGWIGPRLPGFICGRHP
jgi:hypothetical protein